MQTLTVKQAAAQLGITPDTVRALIAQGALQAHKKTLARNSPFVIEAASVTQFDAARRNPTIARATGA